ncbi:MAG: OsmC family protein [Candidatus Omnitrophica bacterium]|nr:OsmC family protein [Candidatus Omnitrophota bacterium]
MVKIDLVYEGDLHCRLTHGPSKAEIATDAPVDNQGKGEAFSPTDLLAAALGSCMLTVMGITARAHKINMDGTKAHVEKEMVTTPVRRVGKITVDLQMPAGITAPQRETLERVAHTCPVHRSLSPDVEVVLSINYPD